MRTSALIRKNYHWIENNLMVIIYSNFRGSYLQELMEDCTHGVPDAHDWPWTSAITSAARRQNQEIIQ